MYKPSKFCEARSLTDYDFHYTIHHYWKFLKVKECCSVLEVGCGPGNSARDSVMPLFPKTLKRYLGVDKSIKMVEYAMENYAEDPRLRFQLLDITTDVLPVHLLDVFDHVVSFNCFHFIFDHRRALENVYRMTKSGGDILISFVTKNVLFEIHEEMAMEDKWRPYLHMYRKMITPTQFYENPQEQFGAELEMVGFSIDLCVNVERSYTFTKKLFLDFVEAVCTFNIPEDLVDDFRDEQFLRMEKRKHVWQNEEGEVYLHFPYTFLVAHAAKL